MRYIIWIIQLQHWLFKTTGTINDLSYVFQICMTTTTSLSRINKMQNLINKICIKQGCGSIHHMNYYFVVQMCYYRFSFVNNFYDFIIKKYCLHQRKEVDDNASISSKIDLKVLHIIYSFV